MERWALTGLTFVFAQVNDEDEEAEPVTKKAKGKGKSRKDELLATLAEDEEIEESSPFPDEDLSQFLNESDVDFSADEADAEEGAKAPKPTVEVVEEEAASELATEKPLSKKAEAKKRKRDEAEAAKEAAAPKEDHTPFDGKHHKTFH